MKIICVHIGARAHYLLPNALQSKGRLSVLITETWVSKGFLRSILSKFPVRIIKSFSNRFSNEIPPEKVRQFGLRFLIAELFLRSKHKEGWALLIARNNYFQQQALKIFMKLSSAEPILATSYTALEIFKKAKERGQKTVLFQIDPGLKEEEIVSDILVQHQNTFPTSWKEAPRNYWNSWLQECELADVIMVNSEWSLHALEEKGIAAEKIKVIPLPYSVDKKHALFNRTYPASFSKERPLRCLFLGTLTLRKGIHLVLEAATLLEDLPVEFILVGNSELDEASLDLPNVVYKGVATRMETDKYYQEADVFLFPTLSDGFGLTQLEAMAWHLPVIASKFCGTVVSHQRNGLVLQDCGVDEICEAIRFCLAHPAELKSMSESCLQTARENNVETFGERLLSLF